MSLPYGDPKWATGNPAIAQPWALPRFSAPIPATTALYILKQDWCQLKNARSPLALNTPHPDYPTYYLVSESEENDLGLGMVRWERTYAQIPATWSDYKSYNYAFPGIADFTRLPGTSLLPRGQINRIVTSRLQYDYYLLDTTLLADAPPKYKSTATMPTNPAFRVMLNGTLSGTAVGAWNAINLFITPSGGATVNGLAYPETCPNADNYYSAVADANTNGWAATVTAEPMSVDGSTHFAYVTLASCTWGGQLVAEDSALERWMGNIYVRTTRFVLAL